MDELSSNCRNYGSEKNNIFKLTAFTFYGFFWFTLAVIIVMPKLSRIPAVYENGYGGLSNCTFVSGVTGDFGGY
jgi:succinate-acetate transporter protein